ncbi:MAG: type II toxin-antitoxin system prevent-host-death family antitoxin [Proteobacteria bacterium]|nr:type II toxin-antitoxin system prevent-host-death family antitoxin [Pseudomonadota bacterium]
MIFVNVRELKAKASEYLLAAEQGESVIILSRGKPRATILPLLGDDLEDFILAHNPKFRRLIEKAAADYQEKGEGTDLDQMIRETREELENKNRKPIKDKKTEIKKLK